MKQTKSEIQETPEYLKIIKYVAGGLELILGVPLLGALIIMGLLYLPLFPMLILHIVGLVFNVKAGCKKKGHIFGICASVFGWIPFVAMGLHITSGVLLILEARQNE